MVTGLSTPPNTARFGVIGHHPYCDNCGLSSDLDKSFSWLPDLTPDMDTDTFRQSRDLHRPIRLAGDAWRMYWPASGLLAPHDTNVRLLRGLPELGEIGQPRT